MPAYELLAFNEANFLHAVSNPTCPQEHAVDHAVTLYLARYLGQQGATFIIVEFDYVDRDYLDDYSSFYAKSFAQYSSRTKRIHAFSGSAISNAEFEAALVGESAALAEALALGYLGFIVARPLPSAIIGRTVLKTYPDDQGRRNYPATKLYRINLFGLSLELNSLAFQQQDRALAACATVALWSCFHKTAELYGTTAPTPGAITQTASIYMDRRATPSQGLKLEQMCEAVRAVELEPEVFRATAGLPIASLIYSYLHMSQPVILVVSIEDLGLHAVTVAGYSMTATRCLIHEAGAGTTRQIPFKGEWINELYAHDDQTGPFAKMILENPTATNQLVTMTCGRWARADGSPRQISVSAILIPVSGTIRIGFSDIAAFTLHLSGLLEGFNPECSWDIFLTESNRYKQTIRGEADTSEPSLAGALLRSHPKYIWCSRLTGPSGIEIEVLHDATQIHGALPAYLVRWFNSALKASVNDKLRNHESLLRGHLGHKFYEFLLEQSA